MPVLFLLDLWGQDPAVVNPSMTSKKEIETRVARFTTLESVYEGLEDFEGDCTNEYLKRFFTIVDSWRTLFEEVCDRIGQNRKYGLNNLRQVRENYPGVPGVFYTRKSLISDAVAMFQAGADGLFIKPTGRDDGQTRKLTQAYAPKLLKELARIVDVRIGDLKGNESRYREESETMACAPEATISSWQSFRNKQEKPD
jgi:hypothetical protein